MRGWPVLMWQLWLLGYAPDDAADVLDGGTDFVGVSECNGAAAYFVDHVDGVVGGKPTRHHPAVMVGLGAANRAYS
jgi:hypothetical protein